MPAIRHQVLGACIQAWGEAWRLLAACRGLSDADILFFAEGGRGKVVRRNTARGKAICKSCPVTEECLQFALDYDVPFGVYGGLTRKERERLTS